MTTLFDVTKETAEQVCQTYLGAATATTNETTLTDSNLNGIYPNDHFNGGTLFILSGTHKGKSVIITDYATAGTFTFEDIGTGNLTLGNQYLAARINYTRGQLWQAVNNGLRSMGKMLLTNDFLLSVEDRQEYDLPYGVSDVRRVQVGDDSITVVTGTAESGTTATLVDTALQNVYANDYFNDGYIRFTSGTNIGIIRKITDYAGASGTFTFAALDNAITTEGFTAHAELAVDAFEFETHYWWNQVGNKLVFDYHIPGDDDAVIRLFYLGYHDELDTDSDTVDANVPLERLVAEASLEAFNLRTRLIGDDDPNTRRDIKETTQEVMQLRLSQKMPAMSRDPHLANV